jgi:hypothetical protein
MVKTVMRSPVTAKGNSRSLKGCIKAAIERLSPQSALRNMDIKPRNNTGEAIPVASATSMMIRAATVKGANKVRVAKEVNEASTEDSMKKTAKKTRVNSMEHRSTGLGARNSNPKADFHHCHPAAAGKTFTVISNSSKGKNRLQIHATLQTKFRSK